MGRPRLQVTLGSLMATVFVCAYLLYWFRPLYPLILSDSLSQLAPVALIPIGVLAVAFFTSRSIDRHVARIEAGRKSGATSLDQAGPGADERSPEGR